MNERFVAVSRLRGLGYAVAFLSRDVISVSRGGGVTSSSSSSSSSLSLLRDAVASLRGVEERIMRGRCRLKVGHLAVSHLPVLHTV